MPSILSQCKGPWSRRSILSALAAATAFAERPKRAPYALETMPSEIPDLIDRYRADLRAIDAFYPLTYASARIEVLRDFHRVWLKSIEQLPFESYDVESRIDWLMLRNTNQRALALLDLDESRWREMQALLAFAPSLWRLEEIRQRVDPIEGREAAGILVNVTKQIKELDTWLKKPDTPKQIQGVALRAYRLTVEMEANLKKWFAFYQGYDPLFE
ncbi:MAG: hypothetical protein NTW74_14390, partial [Acidobacteria bacterium]|nr:hypothetical protein [Acidobacteriota bacterium]